jgi:hypothetical protein
MALDQPMVERLMAYDGTNRNLFLVDEMLPAARLWSRLSASRAERSALEADLWRIMGGIGGPLSGLWMALLAGAFMGGLHVLSRYHPFTKRCMKCGRPVCLRCNRELRAETHCSQCFYVFLQRGAVDPQLRAEKEQNVKRYRHRLDLLARALTVVAMGSGHLFEGLVIRGLLLFTVYLFVVLNALFPLGFLRDSVAIVAITPMPRVAALAVLFVLAYAAALIDILRGR